MAKQTGIFQFKGKLGQVVGRRNAQRSMLTTVGDRDNIVAIAPSSVANPKTALQATQRMKMRAAVNFYRQIGFILNHSWQGIGYKSPSRNFFMRKALSKADYLIPFLPKGYSDFVPGEYPISEGSLMGVDVISIANNAVTTSLIGANTPNQTIGEISQAIVSQNAGFYEGDKLTIIFVYKQTVNGASRFNAVSLQFLLNSDDETQLPNDSNPLTVTTGGDNNNIVFGTSRFGNQSSTLVGAAIVHVRAPQASGGAWQRSSSYMSITEEVANEFMSAEAFNTALASYQKAEESYSSDWYLNTGATNEGGTSGSNSVPTIVTVMDGYAVIGTKAIVEQNDVTGNADYGKWSLFKATSTNSVMSTGEYKFETAEAAVAEVTGATGYITINEAKQKGIYVQKPAGDQGGSVEEQP